jgi:hypothetical protein
MGQWVFDGKGQPYSDRETADRKRALFGAELGAEFHVTVVPLASHGFVLDCEQVLVAPEPTSHGSAIPSDSIYSDAQERVARHVTDGAAFGALPADAPIASAARATSDSDRRRYDPCPEESREDRVQVYKYEQSYRAYLERYVLVWIAGLVVLAGPHLFNWLPVGPPREEMFTSVGSTLLRLTGSFLLGFGGIVWIAWNSMRLSYRVDRFGLTRSIWTWKAGVLALSTSRIALVEVTDVRISSTVREALLGVGNVQIHVRGERAPQQTWIDLRNPTCVRDRIIEAARRAGAQV